MATERQTYTAEFKREAVRLASEPGVTMAQVARELGLRENLIGKWRRQMEVQEGRAFPGHGHVQLTDVEALQRELERVRRERDILKKALGIFTQQLG